MFNFYSYNKNYFFSKNIRIWTLYTLRISTLYTLNINIVMNEIIVYGKNLQFNIKSINYFIKSIQLVS